MAFGGNDSRDTSRYLQGIDKRSGKNKGTKLPKPLKVIDVIKK